MVGEIALALALLYRAFEIDTPATPAHRQITPPQSYFLCTRPRYISPKSNLLEPYSFFTSPCHDFISHPPDCTGAVRCSIS